MGGAKWGPAATPAMPAAVHVTAQHMAQLQQSQQRQQRLYQRCRLVLPKRWANTTRTRLATSAAAAPRRLRRRVPPPIHKPGRKPPRIDFPEDRLLDAYYSKHPEVRRACSFFPSDSILPDSLLQDQLQKRERENSAGV